MLILYLCGMGKAWSEVKISRELYESMKMDGKLSTFEDYIHNNLSNFIGIKLVENGGLMTNEIKSKILYSKKLEANGDVIYHAVVYVPENAKSGT